MCIPRFGLYEDKVLNAICDSIDLRLPEVDIHDWNSYEYLDKKYGRKCEKKCTQ